MRLPDLRIVENEEKKRIELHFAERPSRDVLDWMKARKFVYVTPTKIRSGFWITLSGKEGVRHCLDFVRNFCPEKEKSVFWIEGERSFLIPDGFKAGRWCSEALLMKRRLDAINEKSLSLTGRNVVPGDGGKEEDLSALASRTDLYDGKYEELDNLLKPYADYQKAYFYVSRIDFARVMSQKENRKMKIKLGEEFDTGLGFKAVIAKSEYSNAKNVSYGMYVSNSDGTPTGNSLRFNGKDVDFDQDMMLNSARDLTEKERNDAVKILKDVHSQLTFMTDGKALGDTFEYEGPVPEVSSGNGVEDMEKEKETVNESEAFDNEFSDESHVTSDMTQDDMDWMQGAVEEDMEAEVMTEEHHEEEIEAQEYEMPIEVVERYEMLYAGSEKVSGYTYQLRIDDGLKNVVAPDLRDLKEREHLFVGFNKWFKTEEGSKDFHPYIMVQDENGEYHIPDGVNYGSNRISLDEFDDNDEAEKVKKDIRAFVEHYEEGLQAEKKKDEALTENEAAKVNEGRTGLDVRGEIKDGKLDSVDVINVDSYSQLRDDSKSKKGPFYRMESGYHLSFLCKVSDDGTKDYAMQVFDRAGKFTGLFYRTSTANNKILNSSSEPFNFYKGQVCDSEEQLFIIFRNVVSDKTVKKEASLTLDKEEPAETEKTVIADDGHSESHSYFREQSGAAGGSSDSKKERNTVVAVGVVPAMQNKVDFEEGKQESAEENARDKIIRVLKKNAQKEYPRLTASSDEFRNVEGPLGAVGDCTQFFNAAHEWGNVNAAQALLNVVKDPCFVIKKKDGDFVSYVKSFVTVGDFDNPDAHNYKVLFVQQKENEKKALAVATEYSLERVSELLEKSEVSIIYDMEKKFEYMQQKLSEGKNVAVWAEVEPAISVPQSSEELPDTGVSSDYNPHLSQENLLYIHSDEFKKRFGDWEKAYRLEKLKNSPVLQKDGKVILDGEDITEDVLNLQDEKNNRLLRVFAKDIGRSIKGVYHNADTDTDISVSMANIDEIKNHHVSMSGHLEAIQYIPDIIENGIFISEELNNDKEKHQNIEKYKYFVTGLNIGGTDYTCKSVVGVDAEGNCYYDQRLSQIEKGLLLSNLSPLMSREKPLQSLLNYDTRLLRICQCPQSVYLNEHFVPTKETVDAVRNGTLHVEKNPDGFEMIHDDVKGETVGKELCDMLSQKNKREGKLYVEKQGQHYVMKEDVVLSGVSDEELENDYIHSEEFLLKFGDWEKANRLEKLKVAEPIIGNSKIEVEGSDITSFVYELRKSYSRENLKQLQEISRDVGRDVIKELRQLQNVNFPNPPVIKNLDSEKMLKFQMTGINEIKNHDVFNKGHIEAISSIPEIVKNCIYISSEGNEDSRKPQYVRFNYFGCGYKLEDEDYTVKIVFGETKNGDLFYDQSLSSIEKGRLLDIISEKNKPGMSHSEQNEILNPLISQEDLSVYDKRLVNICQVPQMPYLVQDSETGKWQPSEEAIELVREGKLHVEKQGQHYVMKEDAPHLPDGNRPYDFARPVPVSDRFAVDFVDQGYGEKTVRFIDMKHAQIAGQYSVSTLLAHEGSLVLDGSVSEWTIDADAMRKVHEICSYYRDNDISTVSGFKEFHKEMLSHDEEKQLDVTEVSDYINNSGKTEEKEVEYGDRNNKETGSGMDRRETRHDVSESDEQPDGRGLSESESTPDVRREGAVSAGRGLGESRDGRMVGDSDMPQPVSVPVGDGRRSGQDSGIPVSDVRQVSDTAEGRMAVPEPSGHGPVVSVRADEGWEIPLRRLTSSEVKKIRLQCMEILKKDDGAITDADKEFLRRFEGAGGTGDASAGAYEQLTAYYTPEPVISKISEIVKAYAPDAKSMLEPACGTGRFASVAEGMGMSDIVMYERDESAARIARLLHPASTVKTEPFQKQFFVDGRIHDANLKPSKYDLVLGNPPYMQYSDRWRNLGEGKEFDRYDEYFLSRGLDSLKDSSSLLVMVMPSSFLRGKADKSKRIIASKGILVDAYRLPSGLFAVTDVDVDIVVMKKGSCSAEDLSDSSFFKSHPEKVLGVPGERKGQYGHIMECTVPHDGLTPLDELEKVSSLLADTVKVSKFSVKAEAVMEHAAESEGRPVYGWKVSKVFTRDNKVVKLPVEESEILKARKDALDKGAVGKITRCVMGGLNATFSLKSENRMMIRFEADGVKGESLAVDFEGSEEPEIKIENNAENETIKEEKAAPKVSDEKPQEETEPYTADVEEAKEWAVSKVVDRDGNELKIPLVEKELCRIREEYAGKGVIGKLLKRDFFISGKQFPVEFKLLDEKTMMLRPVPGNGGKQKACMIFFEERDMKFPLRKEAVVGTGGEHISQGTAGKRETYEDVDGIFNENRLLDADEFFSFYGKGRFSSQDFKLLSYTDYAGFIDASKVPEEFRDYIKTSDKFVQASPGMYQYEEMYRSGNIYQKLDALEGFRKELGEDVYERNRKILLDVLPPKRTLDEIMIMPLSSLAENFTYDVTVWKPGEGYRSMPVSSIENVTLQEGFLRWATGCDTQANAEEKDFARVNKRDFIADFSKANISRNDIPAMITWTDIANFIDGIPVSVASDTSIADPKEQAKEREARSRQVKNVRMRAATELFRKFLNEGLDLDAAKKLENLWNRLNNNERKADYLKVPFAVQGMSTYNRKGKFILYPQQVKGASFLCSKGNGLLAYDVGVGKTATGIIAVVSMIQSGRAKRPLIVVPNSVYPNWVDEIKTLFPDKGLNEFYNFRSDYTAEYFNSKTHGLNVPENSISICTISGLDMISFTDESCDTVLQDDFKELLSADGAKGVTTVQAALGTTAAVKNKAFIYFENTGFDLICADEAHRYKNLFTLPSPKKGGRGKKGISNEFAGIGSGDPSKVAKKMFAMTQIVQRNNHGRNVFFLTATPFSNNPLEVYSMLSFVARNELKERDIYNLYKFCCQFADCRTEWSITADQNIAVKTVMKQFRDVASLQQMLSIYFDRVDAEQAGIVRPTKFHEKIELSPTPLQEYIFQAERERMNSDDNQTLSAISRMKMACLSPALLNRDWYPEIEEENFPSLREVVECSPKLKAVCESIVNVWKDSPEKGQLVIMQAGKEAFPYMKKYCVERGIPEEAIEICMGDTKDDKKEKLKKRFNSESDVLKILFGTDVLKEGLDLNGNSLVLYTPFLWWNPTDMVQAEGRIHRQGNMQKNVFNVTPFLADSVDSVLLQKLDEKTNRINDIWSYTGTCDAIDVSEVNPADLKFDLIRDPVKRADLYYQKSVAGLLNDRKSLDDRSDDFHDYIEAAKKQRTDWLNSKSRYDRVAGQCEEIKQSIKEIRELKDEGSILPREADSKIRNYENRLEGLRDERASEYLHMQSFKGIYERTMNNLEKKFGLASLEDSDKMQEILNGFVVSKREIDVKIEEKKLEAQKMVDVYRQELDGEKACDKPEVAARKVADKIISSACYVDEEKRRKGEIGRKTILQKIAGKAISGMMPSVSKSDGSESKCKAENMELF